jgi:hypothetical protein
MHVRGMGMPSFLSLEHGKTMVANAARRRSLMAPT